MTSLLPAAATSRLKPPPTIPSAMPLFGIDDRRRHRSVKGSQFV